MVTHPVLSGVRTEKGAQSGPGRGSDGGRCPSTLDERLRCKVKIGVARSRDTTLIRDVFFFFALFLFFSLFFFFLP